MNDTLSEIKKIFDLKAFTPINLEKFTQIIQGDSDLGLSLLTLFKQQAYQYLDNLHYAMAIKDKDPKKLFEAAHAIKGASLSIAAEEITVLSTKIEHEVYQNTSINQSDYHQLVSATQALLTYITALEAKQVLR